MMWLVRFTCALILVALGGVSTQVAAHDLGLAQVSVSKSSGGAIVLRSKLSATLVAANPVVPENCSATTEFLQSLDMINHRFETRILCAEDHGQILLPWQVDGVFLISQTAGQESEARFVPASGGGITLQLGDLFVNERGLLETAILYTKLGVEHIWIGLDHLALLVCLALLAKGMVLVRLVTAFSIGHSITLCLAALQLVQVPIAPVEVMIVVSVAYLARLVWLGGTMDRSSTGLLVAVGLLHGMGFASVLTDIGLPQSDLLLALFSFNIGIEIGQLVFLLAAIAVFETLRRSLPVSFAKPMPVIVSFLIGSLAMFWSFERFAGFFA